MLDVAMVLLTNKFGSLPKDVKEDIFKTDTTTLEKLIKNIFEIENMEDVRKYLN